MTGYRRKFVEFDTSEKRLVSFGETTQKSKLKAKVQF